MLLVLQGIHRTPPTEDYFTLVGLLSHVVRPYQCLVPRLRNYPETDSEPNTHAHMYTQSPFLYLSLSLSLSLPLSLPFPLSLSLPPSLSLSLFSPPSLSFSLSLSLTPSPLSLPLPLSQLEEGPPGLRPWLAETVPPWLAVSLRSREDTASPRPWNMT